MSEADRIKELVIASHEKEIEKILKASLDESRAKMAVIYEKYARGGILSHAEMSTYNRMASMEDSILSITDPALAKTTKIMERLPREVYNESFFASAWEIDVNNGIRLNWGTVNTDAMAAILDNPLDKISLEQYGYQGRASIRQTMASGLGAGKSYLDMSRALKKSLETTAYRALRITRTEGQTAMNAGAEEAYKRAVENGIEGDYVWDATLDGRTRPSHQKMDQKARDEETGTFDGPGNENARFPGDSNLSAENRVNCRCRLRFQVAGYAPLLRRTRDKGLVPYQDYKTWLKGQTPKLPPERKLGKVVLPKGFDRILGEATSLSREAALKLYLAGNPSQRSEDTFNQVHEMIEQFVKHSTPIQRTKVSHFEKMLDDGIIKNQFQTGTSQGALNETSRNRWEQHMLPDGMDIHNIPIELRPKYGTLFHESQKIGDGAADSQYGRVVLKYKPEILDRSTLTLYNSSRMQPTGSSSNVNRLMASDNPTWMMDEIMNQDQYLEMQMWGSVTLDDIASISISSNDHDKIPYFIEKLKKLGLDIPITEY